MARYAAGKSQRALRQIRRWRKHQQLQKAEYALKRLQQQHPKHPGLWYELGRLAEAQGQLARAAQAYQRALYFQPRLAEAHFVQLNGIEIRARMMKKPLDIRSNVEGGQLFCAYYRRERQTAQR